MSTVTFHPLSKHNNCPLPCYAHLLLAQELGDFYSTWKVRQVTSNSNVGQGEGSLETQFSSFPSGGRG